MEQYHSDALWWARPVESTRNQNWETCRLFPSKEGSDVCSPRKLEWMLSNNLVTLCYPTESAFTRFQIPQYPKQSSQSVEPIFMLSTDHPPPLPQTLILNAVFASRTHSCVNGHGCFVEEMHFARKF